MTGEADIASQFAAFVHAPITCALIAAAIGDHSARYVRSDWR